MKKKASALENAVRHYHAGRYAQVISALEPQIFMYRENAFFYHLLGLSCMKTGDYGGARSYLLRSSQAEPDSIPPRLALAACDLARRRTNDALQMWLEILDEDPENKYALKGLKLLRTELSSDELDSIRDDDALASLYPDIRRKIRIRPFAYAGGVILLTAVALVFVPPMLGRLLTVGGPVNPQREGGELTILDRTEELTQPSVTAQQSDAVRYELDESEVAALFERIRTYFLDERDNLAGREINRVLHSNASETVKNRARLLQSYLKTPTFADFADGFPFSEVRADPFLYEGTYVRWRGRPSNLSVTDEEITFDLLVGYEDFVTVDGIVPVRFTRAVRVEPQFAVEVLGRIRRNSNAPDGIQLEGAGIRLIQPVEGS